VEASRQAQLWRVGEPFRDHLLPISKRTANRLVSIARETSARKWGQNVAHLPYSLTTLYALAQVPINTLEKAIADGFVFPEMTARECQEALWVKRWTSPSRSTAKQNIDSISANTSIRS